MKKLWLLSILLISLTASAQWKVHNGFYKYTGKVWVADSLRLSLTTQSLDTINYKLIVSDALGNLKKMPWPSFTGGGLSGLTTNTILKAGSSSTAVNSSISDNGTTITSTEDLIVNSGAKIGASVTDGDASFIGGILATTHFPYLGLRNPSAGTDAKQWNWYVGDDGVLHNRIQNDANTSAQDWMTVSRTAATSSTVLFNSSVRLSSTSTTGYVWTASGTDGTGAWAAAVAAQTSNIKVYSDYTTGNSTTQTRTYTTANDGISHMYFVAPICDVTTGTGTITVTMTYTSDLGLSRTVTFYNMGTTTSTFTSGTSEYPPVTINASPNTVISVIFTVSGSENYTSQVAITKIF